MKLKICGITNLVDARYGAAAGADFLGFIRVPETPRYVEATLAHDIIEWVSGSVPVGVYANSTAEQINEEAKEIGFGYIQLHSEESPSFCQEIELPVIKSFRVRPEDTVASLSAKMEAYQSSVHYFLLDTYQKGMYGGTGKTFNWEMASILAKEFPIFLAGGINTSNVADALQTVRPFGIDVSSGLEASPGIKDLDKIDTFFEIYDRFQ